jgi:hypothetical protein
MRLNIVICSSQQDLYAIRLICDHGFLVWLQACGIYELVMRAAGGLRAPRDQLINVLIFNIRWPKPWLLHTQLSLSFS